jgi:hypothetical protein
VLGVGIDKQNRVSLFTRTARPDWFLCFADGQIVAAIHDLPEGPGIERELAIEDPASLTRKNAANVWLSVAASPSVDDPAWYDRIGGIVEAWQTEQLAPKKARISELDARMARAPREDLVARLDVLRDMALVANDLADGVGGLLPAVEAWRSRHVEAFQEDLKARLGEDASRFTVRTMTSWIYGATAPKAWATWPDKRITDEYRAIEPRLAFELAFLSIPRSRPVRAVRRAAALGAAEDVRIPRSTQPKYYWEDECGAFRQVAASGTLEPFGARAAEMFGNMQAAGALGTWYRHACQLEAVVATRALVREPVTDLATEVARMPRASRQLEELTRLREPLAAEVAERLARIAENTSTPLEASVARALAASCLDQDAFAETLENAPELLRAARAATITGSLDERVAAILRLTNRTAELGPACERLAIELALPTAREIAARAGELSDRGALALAGIEYLRAATLGARSLPEPISAWQARRMFNRHRQLERGEATLAEGEEPLSDRDVWLVLARIHALAVSATTLPPVSTDEPAYELENRYVGAQLAGRLRAATTFGVRLSGLRDVRRAQSDGDAVRLVEVGGAIRWRATTDDSGAPVDLAAHRIDAGGWSKLRTLRNELDQAEADLEAARASQSLTPDQLAAQDRKLADEAKLLLANVQNGQVARSEAQIEIDRMKRESQSLKRAIANYNRRTAHINEMVEAFNVKVNEHNALLARLLSELSVAYTQLLEPATTAWIESRIAEAKGIDDDERTARRWMLGLDAAPRGASLPLPHPDSLARVVRDVSDPAIASDLLDGALAARLAERERLAGETLRSHLETLAPTFTTYADIYGGDDFVARVLRPGGRIPASEFDHVVTLFEGKRRAQIEKELAARK